MESLTSLREGELALACALRIDGVLDGVMPLGDQSGGGGLV